MQSQGMSSHFWVNPEALALCESRADWVGNVYPIDKHLTELAELAKIVEFCQRQQIQAIVVDGYHFTQGYRKALKSLGLVVLCFDDTNSAGQLWADIIINGAGNAATLGYEHSNPNATLCLGESYRVMRSEFSASQTSPFAQRDELLITLGGSDPLGLTLPLLRSLEQSGFNGKLTVVTGAANQQVEQIHDFTQNSSLSIQHLHDCQAMAKQMQQARLTLAAAGGSQFELQACGCPSVLMVVAENQLNATLEAVNQDWCCWYDCRALATPEATQRLIDQLVAQVHVLWSSDLNLQQWHQNALNTADMNGAQRVVNTLLKALADA
jgi:UDP-2,4-diacetamido-2,4,6-trideoxy-beta-L-altropyranose hydrolase